MALNPAVVVTPASVRVSFSARTLTAGWRRRRASANSQDVVACRPSSTPASAARKAPTQIVTSAAPFCRWARMAATSGPSDARVASRSSPGASSKPGTIRMSASRSGVTAIGAPPQAVTRRRGDTIETSYGASAQSAARATCEAIVSRSGTPNTSEAKQPG